MVWLAHNRGILLEQSSCLLDKLKPTSNINNQQAKENVQVMGFSINL